MNPEKLSELGAGWAGYVFAKLSLCTAEVSMTLADVFKKFRNSQSKMDAGAFRGFVKHFMPSMLEDRITRLFYFADYDGSGGLSFIEFLRIFGCDLNGNMDDEYFEYVMVRLHTALGKRGGLTAMLGVEDRHFCRYVSQAKVPCVASLLPLA